LILILNSLLSIDVDSVIFFVDLIDIDGSKIVKSIDSESIVALPEKHQHLPKIDVEIVPNFPTLSKIDQTWFGDCRPL